MSTNRRQFLAGLTAAGLTAGLGGPRLARASAVPLGSWKILEIFLWRGVSHRETFWWDVASDDFAPWRELPDTSWFNNAPNVLTPTGITSANGVSVSMGPCVDPLLGSDLWNKLRMMVLSHPLAPHGPAGARGLTGSDPGRPAFAGLGARVGSAYSNPSGAPVSYVVDTGVGPGLIGHATATGTLGVPTQPFVIPLHDGNFPTRLQRLNVPDTDLLLGLYRDRYGDRLIHPTATPPSVRSPGYDAYDAALTMVQNGGLVQPIVGGLPYGGGSSYTENVLTRSVGAALTLLNRSADAAQHVCVLSEGGYLNNDTHLDGGESYEHHATVHNGNMWGLLNALREALERGPSAADGLDLSTTLVAIHSEFGRTYESSDGTGTSHWPHAYPAVLIGGPLLNTGGPTATGNITFASDDHDGEATEGFATTGEPYTPLDFMAALTLAAGIDPFGPDMFALNDSTVSAIASNATDAATEITCQVFGL